MSKRKADDQSPDQSKTRKKDESKDASSGREDVKQTVQGIDYPAIYEDSYLAVKDYKYGSRSGRYFFCHGNLFQMLMGDQIHDFLGERVTKNQQSSIIDALKMWKNFGVTKADELNDSIRAQAAAEMYIEDAAEQGLGNIKNFEHIGVNKDSKGKLYYEEDVGRDTRMYIQYISKSMIDIQKTDRHAVVHIDALKTGKSLLTAMINLPVTKEATSCIRKKSMKEIYEAYFDQIRFKPILSNVYDQAIADGLFVTSLTRTKQGSSYKASEQYAIKDSKGNILEWELTALPKFYQIAAWKLKYKDEYKGSFDETFWRTSDVDDFITKSGFRVEDLMKVMISGFGKFLDTKIRMENNSYITIKSRIKDVVDSFGKVGRIQKVTSVLKTTKPTENDCEFIIDFVNRTLKGKYLLFTIGCKNEDRVILDKNYYENFLFYAYITELKMISETTTFEFDKKKLMSVQMDLEAMGGPSVKNITSYIIKNKVKYDKYSLGILMLKTLGDLSIIAGSFKDGVLSFDQEYKNQVTNFFATVDRTAASIATTLSHVQFNNYTDFTVYPLYKYVLLEQVTTSVYRRNEDDKLPPEFKEKNVKDIVNAISDMSIVDNDEYDALLNADSNCNMLKDEYIYILEQEFGDNPYFNNMAKNIDCSLSPEQNRKTIDTVDIQKGVMRLLDLKKGKN